MKPLERKSNHPVMGECDKMIEELPLENGAAMDAWHKKHNEDHMAMEKIMKKNKGVNR